MSKSFDAAITGHGSVYMLDPVSEYGQAWTDENISEEALMLGNSIAVEHGYIEAIAHGMLSDGLTVSLNGREIVLLEQEESMGYPEVIAYTYEADIHCVDCAHERFQDPDSESAVDREGNPVHAVFTGAEIEYWPVPCGTCGYEIDGFSWIDPEV